MNSPLLKRIAATSIAFLLLIYVWYQIYKSHYSSIQTETASYFNASDSIQVDGIAVRNETLLKNSGEGVIDYILSAGDRIAKGGTIANIYSSEQQVAAKHEVESVEDEIEQLKALESPGDTYAASPDSLNEQIHRKISTLLEQSKSDSLTSLTQSKEDLLYLLNERQLVTGKATDFSARLKELQEKHDSLSQQAGTALGTIVSPVSGYFIPSTDGMESLIDFSKVLSLTYDEVQNAMKTSAAPGDAPGKINQSYNWYFVFTVPKGQVSEFRQLADGSPVSIEFPFVSNLTVPANVEAVNQSASDSPASVVLLCTNMNSELAGIRKETAQVITHRYTGIRISRKAVHFETLTKKEKDEKGTIKEIKKEVSGVYVLHGNQVAFRQVVPLYSTDNYVICDSNPDPDSLMTEKTIKLHDEVVVEGTDLYNGKVIK